MLTIITGKGYLKKEEGGGDKESKKIKIYYVHAPSPTDECRLHVLKTCSNKIT